MYRWYCLRQGSYSTEIYIQYAGLLNWFLRLSVSKVYQSYMGNGYLRLLFGIATLTTVYQCSSIMQYMLAYTNSNMCICFRLLFPLKNIHLFGLPSRPYVYNWCQKWDEDSNNNLNWTSDASVGKAMFGELRWLGVDCCGCRLSSDFRRQV